MQELKAEPRDKLGKKAKAVRLAGFLPAVVYGEGVLSQPLAVLYNDFEKAWREAGESTLLKLDVAGTVHPVLIHDIAYDPLTDRPIHVDFYAVRMDKALRVMVPLEFAGESPAVKNEGGVLIKVAHELEVEAMPADLPHTLCIDISRLVSLGDRIFIKDIAQPKGVKILAPADEVVAIVEAPRSEEELAALEAVPAAGAVEVKTEQEVKKEAKAEVKAETEAEVAKEK